MRKSKGQNSIRILFGLLILTSVTARAAVTSADEEKLYGNITQGHYGISASLNLNSTSTEGTSAFTTFRFSARTQYFLADRFGLGPVLRLTTQSNFTDFSVGPSALYYFWTRERLGAYFSQDVTLRTVTNSGKTSSTCELDSQFGLNYFLYPSVAVGPAVDFFHRFGTATTFNRVNQFALLGQLSIYF